ncbi:hypothetical protein W97_09258 [Coniosporium apollinis CBS 100218]|uniref:Fucose-specific lectin n=1 Tax=Coniosporium apollinis (strain CBS 100218) TaxID=1168221 RepID=R7Z757_CONA1|nr:uncharacterized protein W97_09258 [Coniosporium apollinis CBS 100218]EON69992.1 hypothetical protein W97_09258 [Coniosporium apollinis CBS 100218]
MPDLRKQGWGIFFLYAAYSSPGTKNSRAPVPFPLYLAREHGVLHAQHIKKIVGGLESDNAGAVVYIDNEQGKEMVPTLVPYLEELFREMARPGPDNLAPVRPGFYNWEIGCSQMATSTPDLLTWAINIEPRFDQQYKIVNGKFISEPELYPLHTSTHKKFATQMPVGRQGVLVNYVPTEVPRNMKKFPTVADWNMDYSFVRDPRYPEANPWFTLSGSTKLRGDYNKDSLSMEIKAFDAPKSTVIEGTVIEPEAPIVLSSPNRAFSLDVSGNVVSASKPTNGSEWSAWVSLNLPNPKPVLRRLRALAAISPSQGETLVYYVSKNNQLCGRRKTQTADWTAPAVLAGDTLVHYFSNIITVATKKEGVLVLFIDSHVQLHMVRSLATPTDWPGALHMLIGEKTDKLLPGTGLAAAILASGQGIVLAIGRDLRLYFCNFTGVSQWTEPAPLGEEDQKLCSHSRLAAAAVEPDTVQVAAITNLGLACVYKLKASGSSWSLLGGRQPYPRVPPQDVPDGYTGESGTKTVADATHWSINPYGDIHLGMETEGMTLTCAGTFPGKSAILQRRINRLGDRWYRLP